jgi:hypothetical protein
MIEEKLDSDAAGRMPVPAITVAEKCFRLLTYAWSQQTGGRALIQCS